MGCKKCHIGTILILREPIVQPASTILRLMQGALVAAGGCGIYTKARCHRRMSPGSSLGGEGSKARGLFPVLGERAGGHGPEGAWPRRHWRRIYAVTRKALMRMSSGRRSGTGSDEMARRRSAWDWR